MLPETARRYSFLVEFFHVHPLAIQNNGRKELRKLKTALTGLKGNELDKAISQDILNNSL